MPRSDLGRLSSIQRTAKLIAMLLSGRDLTRSEATALLGVRVAAVDRQLEAIGRHVPLVRERRKGQVHVRIDRSKITGGAERVPIATMIAAFVGARKSMRIEPLSLAVYDHQLYVIGRPRGGPTHAYRFSRIETAEAVGGTFPYPDKDSYDPERVFADSFGIIVDDKYPIEQIE